MKKVFFDTNVLLDFLLDRPPYADDVSEIIETCIEEEISICVSPVSITNLNYIIGRLENREKANAQTQKVLRLVQVDSVGQSTIQTAANSKFKDFEDGVQNFCAVEAGHEVIVTGNVKDYKESDLSVLTPKEFLAKLRSA